MAAEDHLVSIGRGDKLQLLGAFAEEEPITSQCSAVQCSAVHLKFFCRETAGGDRNTISIFFINCLSALHCVAWTVNLEGFTFFNDQYTPIPLANACLHVSVPPYNIL